MLQPFRFGLFRALGCFAFLTSAAAGDIPTPKLPVTHFEILIGRIRAAEARGDWKKPDWRDERIEALLKKALTHVKAITGRDAPLPVEFQDVRADGDERAAAIGGGLLRVAGGTPTFNFLNKSIILVDGSVRIGFADSCIVVARGAVEIAHSNHCIVIAGHHIEIGHDGNGGFARGAKGNQPPATASVVVSGGSINIAHAKNTICIGPQYLEISHANDVCFVASPKRDISHERGCTIFDKAQPPLTMPLPETLPAAVFAVKQVVSGDDKEKQFITVERGGFEYVQRPGGKLVDERNQALAGWSNWTVGFIAERFVLFTDGERDLSVRVGD